VCKSCARAFYYSFTFVRTKLQPAVAECNRSYTGGLIGTLRVVEWDLATSP
jgi:hypothetical protein